MANHVSSTIIITIAISLAMAKQIRLVIGMVFFSDAIIHTRMGGVVAATSRNGHVSVSLEATKSLSAIFVSIAVTLTDT